MLFPDGVEITKVLSASDNEYTAELFLVEDVDKVEVSGFGEVSNILVVNIYACDEDHPCSMSINGGNTDELNDGFSIEEDNKKITYAPGQAGSLTEIKITVVRDTDFSIVVSDYG